MADPDLFKYSVPCYSSSLSNQLYMLQQTRTLCDVGIETKRGFVFVHGLILKSTQSAILNKLLPCDDKTTFFKYDTPSYGMILITLLKEEDPLTVKAVVQSLYTGDVILSVDNVQVLKRVYSSLQLDKFVDLCNRFVKEYHEKRIRIVDVLQIKGKKKQELVTVESRPLSIEKMWIVGGENMVDEGTNEGLHIDNQNDQELNFLTESSVQGKKPRYKNQQKIVWLNKNTWLQGECLRKESPAENDNLNEETDKAEWSKKTYVPEKEVINEDALLREECLEKDSPNEEHVHKEETDYLQLECLKEKAAKEEEEEAVNKDTSLKVECLKLECFSEEDILNEDTAEVESPKINSVRMEDSVSKHGKDTTIIVESQRKSARVRKPVDKDKLDWLDVNYSKRRYFKKIGLLNEDESKGKPSKKRSKRLKQKRLANQPKEECCKKKSAKENEDVQEDDCSQKRVAGKEDIVNEDKPKEGYSKKKSVRGKDKANEDHTEVKSVKKKPLTGTGKVNEDNQQEKESLKRKSVKEKDKANEDQQEDENSKKKSVIGKDLMHILRALQKPQPKAHHLRGKKRSWSNKAADETEETQIQADKDGVSESQIANNANAEDSAPRKKKKKKKSKNYLKLHKEQTLEDMIKSRRICAHCSKGVHICECTYTPGPNSFKRSCTSCNLRFLDHNQLYLHLKTVHPVKCSLCDFVNPQESRVAQHMYAIHKALFNEEKFPILKCQEPDCDFMCVAQDSMKTHWARKHSEKKIFCSKCGKLFYNQVRLRMHMKSHDPKEFKYPCEVCGKKFYQKGLLNSHMNVVHNKSNLKMCHLCPWTTTGEREVLIHLYKKHGEPIPEDVKTNTQKRGPQCLEFLFYIILSFYIPEKGIVCDYPSCNYKCSTPHRLRQHKMSKHSEGKGYEEVLERRRKIENREAIPLPLPPSTESRPANEEGTATDTVENIDIPMRYQNDLVPLNAQTPYTTIDLEPDTSIQVPTDGDGNFIQIEFHLDDSDMINSWTEPNQDIM
ncbi:hypothetical protein FSP39_018061 [Pinctada imbricata]|uniref:C2H2-type domain-containing protein n=1 Tax=Pinctada imbricata TaxID=66713 RepID=A0AA88XG72_PINIB|nr:hypothetical protein FSP39_018061 [Pinctada imbricata]